MFLRASGAAAEAATWDANGRVAVKVPLLAAADEPSDAADDRPDRAVARFDAATRPWHGFQVRAGKIFFTLGSGESDVRVADIERD